MSETDQPDDKLPQIIAGVDQQVAAAPILAGAAYGFYEAFVKAGFSEAHAVYLTAVQLHGEVGPPP